MNFKSYAFIFRWLFLVNLNACTFGGPPISADFLNQKLAGKVAGKSWTAKYAYVDPTIETLEDDDYVFVFLPYKPSQPCPKEVDAAADQRSVMLSAPKSMGKATPLKKGSSRNLVFHYFDKGSAVANAALKGKIKLNSIDQKTIKGRVVGTLDGKNYVNGDFVATVCEIGDMNSDNPWDARP